MKAKELSDRLVERQHERKTLSLMDDISKLRKDMHRVLDKIEL